MAEILKVSLCLFMFTYFKLIISEDKTTSSKNEIPNLYSLSHAPDNYTISDELSRKVRVLCLIVIKPTIVYKARHVKYTWGKRCNVILFISSIEDKYLPTIKLQGEENDRGMTKDAFRYVHEKHRKDADWFFKADVDTYVVMENLRLMLADYESKKPLYFGCKYKINNRVNLDSGFVFDEAGYVLSRRALDLLVNNGIGLPQNCKLDRGNEGVEIGKCLSNAGVASIDTRDSQNRGRFFPLPLQDVLFPGHWFRRHSYYPVVQGMECCSDYAVSFHGLDPDEMFLYEFLIYNVRLFGVSVEDSYIPEILKRGHKIVT